MRQACALGLSLRSNICDLLPPASENKVMLDTEVKDERA